MPFFYLTNVEQNIFLINFDNKFILYRFTKIYLFILSNTYIMSKTKINFSTDLLQQIDWIKQNLDTEKIYHFALGSSNKIAIQSIYNTIDTRKLIELDFEKRVTNSGFVQFSKVIWDYYFEITFTD